MSEKEDKIICPTCGNKMILLFTSAICDRCDPPHGVIPLEWWEEFSMRPVELLPWPYGSTAAKQVESARHVVLLNGADAKVERFGQIYFYKQTINTMGAWVLHKEEKVSAKCIVQLYQRSYDRGDANLSSYFYKFPSQYDRITFLCWK